MTGRHEGPPLGSAARDTTAPPYHGKRRAGINVDLERRLGIVWSNPSPGVWIRTDARARGFFDEFPEAAGATMPADPPDDPPRCRSCGHPWDAGCECSCCGDDAPEGWGPDAI